MPHQWLQDLFRQWDKQYVLSEGMGFHSIERGIALLPVHGCSRAEERRAGIHKKVDRDAVWPGIYVCLESSRLRQWWQVTSEARKAQPKFSAISEGVQWYPSLTPSQSPSNVPRNRLPRELPDHHTFRLGLFGSKIPFGTNLGTLYIDVDMPRGNTGPPDYVYVLGSA